MYSASSDSLGKVVLILEARCRVKASSLKPRNLLGPLPSYCPGDEVILADPEAWA
jgi:hypothetical protein